MLAQVKCATLSCTEALLALRMPEKEFKGEKMEERNLHLDKPIDICAVEFNPKKKISQCVESVLPGWSSSCSTDLFFLPLPQETSKLPPKSASGSWGIFKSR